MIEGIPVNIYYHSPCRGIRIIMDIYFLIQYALDTLAALHETAYPNLSHYYSKILSLGI